VSYGSIEAKIRAKHLENRYPILSYALTLALFVIPIPTAAVVPASTGRITPVIHLA
jgi:hypothetical protein